MASERDISSQHNTNTFHEAEERNGDSLKLELYLNALKGDWKSIKGRREFEDLIKLRITGSGETALHIAAIAKQEEFFKHLVRELPDQDLETQNNNQMSALSYVAATGNVKMAEIMLRKNGTLAQPGTQQSTPLYMAALSGHRPMVDYLYDKSEVENWPANSKTELLIVCIKAGFYDVAAKILEYSETIIPEVSRTRSNENAMEDDNDGSSHTVNIQESNDNNDGTRRSIEEAEALSIMAKKPMLHENDGSSRIVINTECQGKKTKQREDCRSLFKELFRRAFPNPESEYEPQLLFDAAESGNIVLVIELIRFNPDIVWERDDSRGSIFHIAVKKRHEGIFNLHHELGSITEMIANQVITVGEERRGKNILHLAAELPPFNKLNILSGAALQMQREVLWFKEVEKIVYPKHKDMQNEQDKTPEELFVETHENMRKAGEKWMKDTAKSSMIVAALITTVAFSAAFSVPGGFNQSSGEPILLNEKFFWVFSLADGIALFSSSTSLLIFLSILTSRYAMNDFLISLPVKLMVGIMSLFISIVAMTISFGAAFILYFTFLEGFAFISFIYCSFAFLPLLYVALNYPLLVDLIRSTCGFHFLFQPGSRRLLN